LMPLSAMAMIRFGWHSASAPPVVFLVLMSRTQHLRRRPQVTLIRRGHEQLAEYLPADAKHKITAVMFNLGYLPGTNKHLTTQPTTTLLALTQALEYLCVGGLTTVVTYPGHAGGKDEATAVQSYVNGLTSAYTVTCCARTNAATPAPELIVIERVR
jgi:Putative rRNA methylase